MRTTGLPSSLILSPLTSCILFLGAVLLGQQGVAMDLYLSPAGSDDSPGTLTAPLQSLTVAQRRIRLSDHLGKTPFTVNLREGTYYLDIPSGPKAQKYLAPAAKPSALWLGATVAALSGEEFSAFGVSAEKGGIHVVTVPAGSPAARLGLKAGDVIQMVNGAPTPSLEELRRFGADNIEVLTYVRGQQSHSLRFTPSK